MLVISLSSVPPRFPKIGATLESLVTQGADRVQLYIPQTYRRFPDWDGSMPKVPQGVDIRRIARDFGPATKVLGAVQEFRGQDVNILFCDDDQYYAPGWARRFLDLKARHPEAVICTLGLHAYDVAGGSETRAQQPRAKRRWRKTDLEFQLRFLWRGLVHKRRRIAPARRVFRRSGYVDVFEGRGGVLVRPEYFDEAAFDIPAVAWAVDDVWLSACVARQGLPIWLEANIPDPTDTEAEAFDPLCRSVVDGADRETANRRAVEHMRAAYGLWP
ncbi:MAG: glycosyltransferase family A protein [Rhodobacter sp.]|nr:glycosyltransferase family A protein [Rhodobacter sp.]